MKLFNLAVLITIWVVGLQYFINNFFADILKNHYLKKHSQEIAKEKYDKFLWIFRIIIILLLIISIIFGTWGLIINGSPLRPSLEYKEDNIVLCVNL